MLDVVGIGRLVYDRLQTPLGLIERSGGSTANTIYRAQELGLRTALTSRVGNDSYGKLALDECSRLGIDVSCVEVTDEPTPLCEIVVTETDRQIITFGSQRMTFRPEHASLLSRTKAVYVGRRLNNRQACMEFCHAHGKQVITTLHGLDRTKEPNNAELKSYPATIVFANENEAVVGKDVLDYVVESRGIAVITMGPNGSEVRRSCETIRSPGFKVKCIDPTGAGDAFAAGFMFGHLRGYDLSQTARIANAAGALATTEYGARTKCLLKPEIEAMVRTQDAAFRF